MRIEGNYHPSDKVLSSCDPGAKSITSDLVLLANALITRNNCPLTIAEFVSFDALKDHDLKMRLTVLHESMNSCDNDEVRLRHLLEMQYELTKAHAMKTPNHQKVINQLEGLLFQGKESAGMALTKLVTRFQVDVLQVIPGISAQEYNDLLEPLVRVEQEVSQALISSLVDALYEMINAHTQTPTFDELAE